MLDNSIERISLCKVSDVVDGQRWLYRLADINDGVITSFVVNEKLPRHFDNRTRLYWKNGPSIKGTIGIWQWSAIPNNNNHDTDYVVTNYVDWLQAIELVDVPGVSKVEELVIAMTEGIPHNAVGPKTLYCISSKNTTHNVQDLRVGILCTASDVVIEGDIVSIKKDVVRLPVFNIYNKDIVNIGGRSFYRTLDIANPQKNILIKEPIEVVRRVIIKRTSWSAIKTQDITKNSWRVMKDFIEKISTESLYQEIADLCGCNEAEAKIYVEKFILHVDSYIEHNDYDSKVMIAAIENHRGLMEKCEAIVEERWRNKHTQELDEAISELEDISLDIEKKQIELDNKTKDVEAAEIRLLELKRNIEEQERLGKEVKEKVKIKITEAYNDVSSFVADMAFLRQGALSAEDEFSGIIPGVSLDSDTMDISNNCDDIVDILKYELIEAGVSEKFSIGLAAYLYAAYVNHMPILLLGPNGESIADAFSAALYGKTAGRLDCSVPYKPDSQLCVENSNDEIIAIKNVFRNEWVLHIPELVMQHMYCFIVHPFIEDLIIEPHSIFNYMTPLFTECFVDSISTNNFVGGRMSDNFILYEHKKTKPLYDKMFKTCNARLLYRKRMQAVITDFHAILKSNNIDLDCIFGVFPYAYITDNHRTPLLDKICENMPISNDLKQELAVFMGDENE